MRFNKKIIAEIKIRLLQQSDNSGGLKQEFMLEDFNVNTIIMKAVVKQSIKEYNSMRRHLSRAM